jgi:hypothetical protein
LQHVSVVHDGIVTQRQAPASKQCVQL